MSAELQPTYRRCIRINAKWGAACLNVHRATLLSEQEEEEEEPAQKVEEEEIETFFQLFFKSVLGQKVVWTIFN